MANEIKPRFNFNQAIPSEGSGQNHGISRSLNNALRAVLFNEYERVMAKLAEIIGDTEYIPGISGEAKTIARGFQFLQTKYSQEVITNNLTVKGSANLGAIQLTWNPTTLYLSGDITVYDSKLYRCKEAHNSTLNFIDDISNWEMLGGGGSSSVDITLTGDPHDFVPGNVLFYYNEYKLAKANNFNSLGLFMVSRVEGDYNFTIMQNGYFEFEDGIVLNTVLEDNSNYFTPNTWYYLSENEAGKLTDIEPHISNPILYAITGNSGYVVGHRPVPVNIPDVYEFTYLSGQTEYDIPYAPKLKSQCKLYAGGIAQYDKDFDINNKILHIIETFPNETPMRFEYRTTDYYAPAASVEEYKFISEEEQTDFKLEYIPLSTRHLIVTVNGVTYDTDDYDLLDDIVRLIVPLPENQRVRILDFRVSTIVSPDLQGISENSIPGNRIQQESIAYSKLEPDVQILLPYTEGRTQLIIHDYVIYSQETFDELIASEDWLGYKNILFKTNVTHTGQITIPASVERIDAINKATLTIHNDSSTIFGYFGYEELPIGIEYQINGLTVLITSDSLNAVAFYNCINLNNCQGIGISIENIGYGFKNCNNIINCIGTGIGEISGYGFYNINYAGFCRSGEISTTDTWGGTNTKIRACENTEDIL